MLADREASSRNRQADLFKLFVGENKWHCSKLHLVNGQHVALVFDYSFPSALSSSMQPFNCVYQSDILKCWLLNLKNIKFCT